MIVLFRRVDDDVGAVECKRGGCTFLGGLCGGATEGPSG